MTDQDPQDELNTKHRFSDFLYWNLVLSVPVVTAVFGIGVRSGWALVAYILLVVVCLVLILRHFCTHCPHYHAGERTVRCLFFWGMPKFFRSESGPLTGKDKLITVTATAVLVLFPFNWLVDNIGMLVIYVLAWIVFALSIRRHECGRCVYSGCPFNATKVER